MDKFFSRMGGDQKYMLRRPGQGKRNMFYDTGKHVKRDEMHAILQDPEWRLGILLRDPMKRLISGYLMMLMKSAGSFV